MTNRKNYNSIVFLTTLSVYLGLVLVSGTPQVSAQSIEKGCFQLHNEDSQPNENDRKLYLASEFVGKPIQILLTHLIELSQQNKLSFEDNFNYQYLKVDTDGEVPQISILNSGGGIWLQDDLKQLVWCFTGWKIGSQLKRFNEKFQKTSYYSEVTFQLNDEGLSIKVKTEQQKPEYAQKAASDNNSYFQNAIIQEQNKVCKVIYQNSESFAENNQVFIVTRLPRGSLNALLAKDAQ
ncbi:MAG: hypothetical protein ACR2MG_00365 [Pyrinomonadaceae bacterium]